ncbi:MAG: hypothetical protein Q9195_007098 [Heterodermia aff. obscurata]
MPAQVVVPDSLRIGSPEHELPAKTCQISPSLATYVKRRGLPVSALVEDMSD